MGLCKSCGNPVNEYSRICPSCGVPIAGEEQISEKEAASEMRQEQEEETSTKRHKKRTLIITAILAIFTISSATTAIILHKSPKELYLLSEYKTYQKSKEGWADKYDDKLEFQTKMMNKPSSSEVNLSGKIEMDSLLNDPNLEIFQELLNKATLAVKTEQDPISNQSYYNLALSVEKERTIDVEMFQTKDRLGLKVPILYEKFFYVNFGEYSEFMQMTDPSYPGPGTLQASNLEWQDLNLTEKEQEYIQKRYGAFLLGNLEDQNFTMKKGVEYERAGETIKVREVTLKLSSSETKNLVNDFMDHLIKDGKLHSMIVTRAQKVAKDSAVTKEIGGPDANGLKRQLVDGLKDAKKEMKDIHFSKGFSSILLINEDEQIIDRKITTAFGSSTNQLNMELRSKNVPYGSNRIFEEFSVALSPEDDEELKLLFQITNDVVFNENNRKENLNASFKVEEYGEPKEIKFSMKSDMDEEKGGKQEIRRDFNLTFVVGDFTDWPTAFKGTIKQTSEHNLKKDYSKAKFELKLGLADELDSDTVTFKLDSKTKIKDKLEMPDLKLDSGAGLNLVNIPEGEMYLILEEVRMNLMELVVKYGLVPEDVYQFDSYDGYYKLEDEDSVNKL
ncbi:zinc ribbon domain-containing protein [Bacillus sp. SD075]|uniref:zinc ribbon domain-containing protein n=1 Tax=Bacillus sp. SD075 TaxID=2781732 RepID=UPI001A96CFC4|nr:zinc ribbon domain-containing protein [Bacillus sp. SD075]MBO1000212.1 zinc ribbon domain-containing protein [Bacillus sp. SD075]